MSYIDDIKLLNKNQSQKYRDNLSKARTSTKRRNLVNDARTLAQSATPWGAASLLKYMILTSPFIYLLALLVALLKDILDWVGIGSLPAIGTVITICVSIFIFFMMLLAGSSGKMKMATRIVRRYLILGAGSLIEFLFGLNFLPVLTLTVLVIWFMAAAETKQEEEERKKQRALEGEEGEMEEEYA